MNTELATTAHIHTFLKTRIAAELQTTPDQIDSEVSFASHRLDSVIMVTLAVDLEDWLQKPIDPSVFWEFPSIAALANWLTDEYLPGLQP